MRGAIVVLLLVAFGCGRFGYAPEDGGVSIDAHASDSSSMDVHAADAYAADATSNDAQVLTDAAVYPPGTPDETFEGDGRVVIEAGGTDFAYHGLVTLPGGGVIVSGETSRGELRALVLKLRSDGTRDPAFATDGLFVGSPPGSTYARGCDLVAQDDGKIVVAGYGDADTSANAPLPLTFAASGTLPNRSSTSFLFRLNADGTLDATFGEGGWVLLQLGFGASISCSVSIDAAGRITLAGFGTNGDPDRSQRIVRVESDGALDTSFGAAGSVNFNMGQNDVLWAHATRADGSVVAAASGTSTSGPAVYVYGFRANGSVDTGFAGDGLFTIGRDADCDAVHVTANAIYLVLTWRDTTEPEDMALVRLSLDGVIDTTFGVDGFATWALPGTQHGFEMVQQTDGRIVVAGSTGFEDAADFLVTRFETDGSVDRSFGDDGIVTADHGGGRDVALGVGIDDQGRLVVAGGVTRAGSNDTDIMLLRYWP